MNCHIDISYFSKITDVRSSMFIVLFSSGRASILPSGVLLMRQNPMESTPCMFYLIHSLINMLNEEIRLNPCGHVIG